MTAAHKSNGACGGSDVHDANNNLKGTEFDVDQRDPDSPIRVGVVTIENVRLRMAVFPQKLSRKGHAYYPVRLQYMPDCGHVLRAVPVGKVRGRS